MRKESMNEKIYTPHHPHIQMLLCLLSLHHFDLRPAGAANLTFLIYFQYSAQPNSATVDRTLRSVATPPLPRTLDLHCIHQKLCATEEYASMRSKKRPTNGFQTSSPFCSLLSNVLFHVTVVYTDCTKSWTADLSFFTLYIWAYCRKLEVTDRWLTHLKGVKLAVLEPHSTRSLSASWPARAPPETNKTVHNSYVSRRLALRTLLVTAPLFGQKHWYQENEIFVTDLDLFSFLLVHIYTLLVNCYSLRDHKRA